MTICIAIRCDEGIWIGSDSRATMSDGTYVTLALPKHILTKWGAIMVSGMGGMAAALHASEAPEKGTLHPMAFAQEKLLPWLRDLESHTIVPSEARRNDDYSCHYIAVVGARVLLMGWTGISETTSPFASLGSGGYQADGALCAILPDEPTKQQAEDSLLVALDVAEQLDFGCGRPFHMDFIPF